MKEVLILFLFLGNSTAVPFCHVHVRPHTPLTTRQNTRQKLVELGQDVLPHRPYLSNPAASDFDFFRSLQNWLRGSSFSLDKAAGQHLVQFFRRYRNGF